MAKEEPFIKPWDVLTCSEGHPLLIAIRPIAPDDIFNWSNYAPLVKIEQDLPSRCPICGRDPFPWSMDCEHPIRGHLDCYVRGKRRIVGK